MSRSWYIAPVLVVGMFATGFLMGDDRKDPIVVSVRLPSYYSKLGLTPKQRNEVLKIRGKYAAEIQELKQKISDLMDQERADCEKVLTKGQKVRLQEILGGSNNRKVVEDEDESSAKMDKKKGAAVKDQKKGTEPKGKNQPAEIKK